LFLLIIFVFYPLSIFATESVGSHVASGRCQNFLNINHISKQDFIDPLQTMALEYIDTRRTLVVKGFENETPQKYWTLDKTPLPQNVKDLISKSVTLAYHFDPSLILNKSEFGQNKKFLELSNFNTKMHMSHGGVETAVFVAILESRKKTNFSRQEPEIIFGVEAGSSDGFEGFGILNIISQVVDVFRQDWEKTHTIKKFVSIHFHPTPNAEPVPLSLPSCLSSTDVRIGLPLIYERLRQHGLNPYQIPLYFGAVAFHHMNYIPSHSYEALVLSELVH
jgi:hypothetical protein